MDRQALAALRYAAAIVEDRIPLEGEDTRPLLRCYVNELRQLETLLAERPQPQEDVLKRIVVAWDTDESLEFLAAMTAGRHRLGLTLADTKEAQEDRDVLIANGYDEHGEPLGSPTP